MKPVAKAQEGQAITEYLVMVLITISIIAAFNYGLRNIVLKVWMQMTCEVTAPCPHCPVSQDVRAAANRVANGACRASP